MKILGIETSCDETAAAIVEDGTTILSSNVASSLEIHKKYGGVVPEIASRKQAEYIIPVLTETFAQAQMDHSDIDAIAVTIGPGLMGPLLVGVDTARTLSLLWNKPLVPVNHLIGHIYSGFLNENRYPTFPLVALIASGGHTDLVLMKGHGDLTLLGSTRDDAVGEAFDKVARLLGLPYPGGPEVEKIARSGDESVYNFPRPMIDTKDFEFSFSGLKTSVRYEFQKLETHTPQQIADLAASFQKAALDVLVKKTIRAVETYHARSLLVTGGVAANQYLKKLCTNAVNSLTTETSLFIPPLSLATDNATYIATAGYFLFDKLALSPNDHIDQILNLRPNPALQVNG